MAERTVGTRDRPFRAPDGGDAEDNRQAMMRLNRRLEAALNRIEYIEQILKDNSLWVDPS